MAQDIDDSTNRKIIQLLNENGRRSFTELASILEISEASARQRVNRLISSEVIRVAAIPDAQAIGYNRKAMIGIRHHGSLAPLTDEVRKLPEVSRVVVTAGGFDVLLEVVCKDDEHLVRLINQGIRSIEGVQTTETFVYLKEEKQAYEWIGQ
ncbi:MAG: Lrp/AsnC family transcriptional regulator [Microbacteriaceae bacterium]|jgi:Lrp/AsnC family transcriptional regulator for asnA, asnC and gidA|nr:Lrp/AsnC family transcriptional regulator [Microbacteriaceae bacterium]MDR9443765.1 Lrp/AsnC family transcriptional regulator [Microbacteriaceae bacterium]